VKGREEKVDGEEREGERVVEMKGIRIRGNGRNGGWRQSVTHAQEGHRRNSLRHANTP
jgi:hypothetical protein